jgi:magnesium transporter
VPVLDDAGVLVGVLLREDVDEARADRADSDALKARGIVGGDELRSLPLMLRSRRRLAWLSINIVLNILAASVIAMYEETLQAVIALAVFLPIISDMSGCSGNQAVAVSLRELDLGVTKTDEIARVLFKESALGLVNGAALGVLIGFAAWAWKGNLALALVVGSALALNTVLAVCIGGAVPMVLRRAGVDPALASGPMLTTITDMCGFFLVLSFATLALAQLTM